MSEAEARGLPRSTTRGNNPACGIWFASKDQRRTEAAFTDITLSSGTGGSYNWSFSLPYKQA